MTALQLGPVHIHLGDKSGKYPDGNQVIVQGADTRVAFDTPLVANRIGAAFDGVDMVILGHVHEDHMAGLHRVPHARVQVHQADLAAAQSWSGLAAHYGYPPDVLATLRPMIERDFHYQSRPDATAYADGAQWQLGGGVCIRAHHLPGHTAGHCALVVESEGVAFIGDIDLTGFGPYYGDATSDLDAFEQSLVRVRELDARVWVTSHHRAVLTERAAFERALDAFAARIGERDDKLLAYLRERPHTRAELAARGVLYPPAASLPWIRCAETRTIAQHLARLQTQGQVRPHEGGVWALAQ
ncbi:MAG: MBL fold metallo-hydrolase [Pseudomonadota bacterium]|nr:MBL fold metallo-hydrolase [Pseudomonadota bacterium]